MPPAARQLPLPLGFTLSVNRLLHTQRSVLLRFQLSNTLMSSALVESTNRQGEQRQHSHAVGRGATVPLYYGVFVDGNIFKNTTP
jgi:hypothetical protein